MPEDKFKEWFKSTSLKDIPLAEFNFHIFERALAMAYSQGGVDKLDAITKEYDLSPKGYR